VSDKQSSWVTLRTAGLAAQIDPFGAQLSGLQDLEGRELLWPGDASIWAGRAPVLFPVVGTLAGGRYRLGSNHYALSRHGFARGKLFDTVTTTESSAVFRLRADDSTLAVYPFRFELDVSFELRGPTLILQALVRNVGDEALPASIGFHPGFRWPLPYAQPRASHYIEFDQEEPAPVRRINRDGLLAPEPHPTPIVHRRLALADALFEDDVLILDQIRSRSVRYGAQQGPRLEIGFSDASYLGLWTRPGAGFICIEPWQGITDPADFSGDIRQKPGIFQVAPGATHSMAMTITSIPQGPS
jgi:galactose mutarotase-like enzyme